MFPSSFIGSLLFSEDAMTELLKSHLLWQTRTLNPEATIKPKTCLSVPSRGTPI